MNLIWKFWIKELIKETILNVIFAIQIIINILSCLFLLPNMLIISEFIENYLLQNQIFFAKKWLAY